MVVFLRGVDSVQAQSLTDRLVGIGTQLSLVCGTHRLNTNHSACCGKVSSLACAEGLENWRLQSLRRLSDPSFILAEHVVRQDWLVWSLESRMSRAFTAPRRKLGLEARRCLKHMSAFQIISEIFRFFAPDSAFAFPARSDARREAMRDGLRPTALETCTWHNLHVARGCSYCIPRPQLPRPIFSPLPPVPHVDLRLLNCCLAALRGFKREYTRTKRRQSSKIVLFCLGCGAFGRQLLTDTLQRRLNGARACCHNLLWTLLWTFRLLGIFGYARKSGPWTSRSTAAPPPLRFGLWCHGVKG